MLFMLLAATMVTAPTIPTPDGAWALSGRVTDTAGVPIAYAQVVIEEAHRSTTTDEQGRYRLDDVPEGVYGVSYRAIGYRPSVLRVTIGRADVVRDVMLRPSVVELAPIQVTATPLATSALDSPQPLAVLQGSDLRAAQAASLGAVVADLPGVRSLSTGNGIAKPVIRGLGGNRVLVLDNGQRTESQQWGDEHAPNVETASAARIEVVRGPASVLYGSDALGGVINVVARELPDAHGGPPVVNGRVDAAWGSNGTAPEGTLLVEGASHGVGFRGSLTGRSSDNVRTPGGTLLNSGYAMSGGSGAAGVRAGWGSLTGTFSRRAERIEIHKDSMLDPGANPLQRIVTDRAGLTGNVSLGSSRLEADLGVERNHRREFESPTAERDGDLELGLRSATVTGNLHLHHAASARVAGVIGIQGHRIAVTTSGEETLVPESRTSNVAAYLYEQVDLGRFQLSLGARVDRTTLVNDADATLGVAAGRRDWTAVSGNAGVLFRFEEPMALVFNVGRGFRAPSAFELFANGEHEGSLRYEVGDPTLETERSLSADLAFRVQASTVQAEVGVFANRVAGYIYPDPTGGTDPESGLPIYQVTQGDATLTGVEAALGLHATRWLHLKLGVDYTRGQNTTTDLPLAFVAPLRATGSLRVEGTDTGVLVLPWIETTIQAHARQSRLDPDDVAPAGYTLASVATGATIGGVEFSVRVQNVFDVRYRPFLSRYKRFADEAGRDVMIRAGLAF